MYTITKYVEFDAAHRVPEHGSKCFNMHGHRYKVEAECSARALHTRGEQTGMVLDFGFLKKILTDKVHDPMDHGTILQRTDPILAEIMLLHGVDDAVWQDTREHQFHVGYWKLYVLDLGPPTAEVLARHILNECRDEVTRASNRLAELTRVTVYETPTSTATYFR